MKYFQINLEKNKFFAILQKNKKFPADKLLQKLLLNLWATCTYDSGEKNEPTSQTDKGKLSKDAQT